MSAALKFAALASGFTLFSASALFTIRNSHHEFSHSALALDYDGEAQQRGFRKPKIPTNFIPITVGGVEIKAAA